MKLTALTSNLKEGLEIVSHGVASAGTLPILSYVFLEAKKSGLEIISTNLELGIQTKIRAKVDKVGKVVVPFRILYDFVSNNPDEKIELFLEGNELKIHTNHFKASILIIDSEEFPLLPRLTNPKEIRLKKEDFLKGIQKILIAPAIDETRPVLAGVLFWLKQKQLILVGTDSFRLAEQKIAQEKSFSEMKTILPLRAVQIATRILAKSLNDEFSIYFSENQLKFEFDDHLVIGRLIEGEYPDYEQIIPKDFSTRLILDRQELEKTLKILSSFSQENNKEIKLEVKNKNLIFRANSPQIGSNEATIDSQIEGGSIKVNFNASYLLDGLGVIEEEEVIFDLTGEISPGILRGKNNQDFTYLVMPLKEE